MDGDLIIPDGARYTILGDQHDLGGKRWTDEDFPEQVKMKFNSYKISVKVYQNRTEHEVARIFARVQEGLPLSSSEKLNAVLGHVRDGIKELSEHELLRNVGISPFRFNHRWIVAHVVYHEINGFAEGVFRKAYYTDLKKMYEERREDSHESRAVLRRVGKIFNYLFS